MRRPIVILTLLALIWGASFMLIKIADRQLTPSTLILGRLGSATLLLAAIAAVRLGPRRTLEEIRGAWLWLVVVGLVNTAIPFWLLSWGETRIDSGLASIIQGAVPIFNALLAFAFFREARVTGLRLVGLGIGFVGVALLVGDQPHGKLLAALAVVTMALCYAIGTLLAGRHLRGTPPLVVALASTAVSTLAVLPVGVAQAPSEAWRGLPARAARGRRRAAVPRPAHGSDPRGAGRGDRALARRAGGLRSLRDRAGRRGGRDARLPRRERAKPDRAARAARDPPALSRPQARRRGGAPVPAAPARGARLPPARARDLRLQRARVRACGARRLRPRGPQA